MIFFVLESVMFFFMYMELIYVVVMIGMICVFIVYLGRYFHMNNTPPPPHPPRARVPGP